MAIPTETERRERLFLRAKQIVVETEERALREKETFHETIQHLAFRIAELEHADEKDEYTQD